MFSLWLHTLKNAEKLEMKLLSVEIYYIHIQVGGEGLIRGFGEIKIDI
jgi:hypothetical protein